MNKLALAHELLMDHMDLWDDPEHQIYGHANDLPETYRRLADLTKRLFELVRQDLDIDIG
jgi:hypothetical protein